MNARCFALLLLLPMAGCASTIEAEQTERIVRFVIIPAPSAGGEEEVPGEDLLLEVVTQLSADADLDFCLVPGPLLGSDSPEACEGLIGALGSLAPQVYPALASSDEPRRELLEALEEGLAGHKGKAEFEGEGVGDLRPTVKSEGALWVEVSGGRTLVVQSGPEVIFDLAVEGQARLVLPPLTEPPHLYALATYSAGALSIQLRSAMELPIPATPPPLRLK